MEVIHKYGRQRRISHPLGRIGHPLAESVTLWAESVTFDFL